MPTTSRKKKPDRIKVGPLSAHPRKPPGKRDARWYWQVIYYDERTQLSARGADGKPAHRRGTPAEIKAHLNTLLEQGGWKRPTQPALVAAELTMDQLCKLWLAHEKKRRDLGKASAKTYENRYRWWKNHVSPGLGAVPLHAIDQERLQDWVDALSTGRREIRGRAFDGYAPRSIINYFRVVRRAWKWGTQQGHTPHPLPHVELPKVDGYVYNHTTPTLADAYAVIEQLRGHWRVAGRLYLLTGARFGEIASLTWSDWDRAEQTLTLTGKRGTRVVPTGAELQRELLEWWVRCGQPTTGTVLRVPRTTLKTLGKHLVEASAAIHVAPFSPQGFRRLASTRLIALGPEKVPVKEYEAAMGHSYEMGLKTYSFRNGQLEPPRLTFRCPSPVKMLVKLGDPETSTCRRVSGGSS